MTTFEQPKRQSREKSSDSEFDLHTAREVLKDHIAQEQSGTGGTNMLGYHTILKAFRYIGDQHGITESSLKEKLKICTCTKTLQDLNLHELYMSHDKDEGGTLDLMEFEEMLKSSTLLQKAVYEMLQAVERKEELQATSDDSQNSWQSRLEHAVLIVVCLNCFVMALSADFSPDWIGWQLIEACFLVAFIMEIILNVGFAARIRLASQGEGEGGYPLCRCILRGAQDYLSVPMNIFDVAITILAGVDVMLALFEVGGNTNLTVLRLFRLARLGRLAKIFRRYKELGLLISGIVEGMRTVIWSFVLLGAIVFTLAVLLRQNRAQDRDEQLDHTFSSVPEGMVVIFRCLVIRSEGACLDSNQQPFFESLSDEMGWLFKIPWMASEVLVVCGILNVVTSVFFVQAMANEQVLQSEINRAQRHHENTLLTKLDKLIRTLVRPVRKSTPPLERNATAVIEFIQRQHPEVLSKVSNLGKEVMDFARNIQDSKETYQMAMDVYESRELDDCIALRAVPCALLHYVDSDEQLLTSRDSIKEGDVTTNCYGIGVAPHNACEVLLLQETNHLAELSEDAEEAQQYVKSLILPDSAWAQTAKAGSSGEAWHESNKLCDEAVDPGTKDQSRVREKVEMKYEGKYERNRDYARIGLVYKSVKHMIHSLRTLLRYQLQSDGIQVVQIDNRFREPTPLGWMDITLLVRVRVPSSGRRHIMELQLQLGEMVQVRETKHDFYSKIRPLLPDDALTMIIDQLTMDTTFDLGMTTKEWLECLKNEEVKNILDELRVPDSIRTEITNVLDADGSGRVTSAELRNGLLRCRGKPQAGDLIDCKLKIQHLQHYMQTHLESQVHIIHDMLIGNGRDMLQILKDMLEDMITNNPRQDGRVTDHAAERTGPVTSNTQEVKYHVLVELCNKDELVNGNHANVAYLPQSHEQTPAHLDQVTDQIEELR